MSAQKKEIIAVVADDSFRHLLEGLLSLHKIDAVAFFDKIEDVPDGVPVAAVLDDSKEGPVRLGAVLDRIKKHLSGAGPAQRSARIVIGPYHFMPDDSVLAGGDGGDIRLTEKERDILLKLCSHRGEIITHAELLEDVWGYAENIETHTLETHIYRLRRKIEKDPARPVFLLTEDTGYRLAGF